jgi:RNA polymerase sigma factor (TIGR02999 family)
VEHRPQSDGQPGQVTQLLRAARAGDPGAIDQVIPLVYEELRLLARRQIRREFGDHGIQPTALVHEAYLKLVGGNAIHATDRSHFLRVAARAMRQVLVDDARQRNAAKRGEGWGVVTLNDGLASRSLDPDELLALNDALDRLPERQRQVVELRFFAGLDELEAATALGVTERTIRRDWTKARAWLNRWLYSTTHVGPGG